MDGDALKNRNIQRENSSKANKFISDNFGRENVPVKNGFERMSGEVGIDDEPYLPPHVVSYLNRGDTYDFGVTNHENDDNVPIRRYDMLNGNIDTFDYNKRTNRLLKKDANGEFKQVPIQEYGFGGDPLSDEALEKVKAYGFSEDEAIDYLRSLPSLANVPNGDLQGIVEAYYQR